MITVNVWDAQGTSPGHASLILSATAFAPELTVSWWPVDGGVDMFLGDEAATLPYTSELLAEGRPPETRYRLASLDDSAAGVSGTRPHIGLDQVAMRDWWNEWSLDGAYRLIDRNCCTTVISCLHAGGSREYTELAGLTWVPPESLGMIMTPARVHVVCRAIQQGMTMSRF